eukprot:TRINITY_DN4624_c0_g1_i1.p1 TRINITY_DN4624_c0_g1~~TRINITY_DN4624_c0_g1_i1.p1  ORF type:complete len:339 (-),score=106.49 TRINITY_DN4624_c0_g1_i1:144-1160(-)
MTDLPEGHKKTAEQVSQGVDLSGKVAIVTGASSGLGIETARVLALRGAHVFFAVRDTKKAEPIAAQIKAETKNDKVEILELNLSSFKSVRAFVSAFLERKLPLHYLINNAGIMATPEGRTEDGWELQFGTNHLGHFLLTTLLTDTLIASAPSRVVSVSSVANKRGGINWGNLNLEGGVYNKWLSYAQSKTANVLFAVEYNRRYKDKGVTCNALHPGGIMTGLQWNVPDDEKIAMGWMDKDGNLNARFKSIEQGAATSIWAALAPELEGNGGHYLEDCSISGVRNDAPWVGCAPHALDVEDAKRLWDFSVEAVEGKKSVDELVAAEKAKEEQKKASSAL